MSYKKSQVAFIDTETTGLHPDFHGIWDIAIIIDDEEHCWQNWVDTINVDDWVRENTRFGTEYDAEHALDNWETAIKLGDLLKGRHLVGACPWFDSERLHKLWRHFGEGRNRVENHNHPWHYHLMDVECLLLGYKARDEIHVDHKSLETVIDIELDLPIKSTDIMAGVGIEPLTKETGHHTAIGDARKAKECWEFLFGEGI
jgi:hypothetical protein